MKPAMLAIAALLLVASPTVAEPLATIESCDITRGQWIDCRVSVPTGLVGGFAPAPYGHVYCSSQGALCEWDGGPATASIAFGVDGDYFVRGSLPQGTACASSVFQDPQPSRPKACYASTTGTPDVSQDFQTCASEGQWCAFSGMRDVAFGNSDAFHLRTGLQGGTWCTAGSFIPIATGERSCYVSIAGNARRAIIGVTTRPACGWIDDTDAFHPHAPGPGCAFWLAMGHGDLSVPLPNP